MIDRGIVLGKALGRVGLVELVIINIFLANIGKKGYVVYVGHRLIQHELVHRNSSPGQERINVRRAEKSLLCWRRR